MLIVRYWVQADLNLVFVVLVNVHMYVRVHTVEHALTYKFLTSLYY